MNILKKAFQQAPTGVR